MRWSHRGNGTWCMSKHRSIVSNRNGLRRNLIEDSATIILYFVKPQLSKLSLKGELWSRNLWGCDADFRVILAENTFEELWINKYIVNSTLLVEGHETHLGILRLRWDTDYLPFYPLYSIYTPAATHVPLANYLCLKLKFWPAIIDADPTIPYQILLRFVDRSVEETCIRRWGHGNLVSTSTDIFLFGSVDRVSWRYRSSYHGIYNIGFYQIRSYASLALFISG